MIYVYIAIAKDFKPVIDYLFILYVYLYVYYFKFIYLQYLLYRYLRIF